MRQSTLYAISACGHIVVVAALSFCFPDDFAGGLLPVAGGGGGLGIGFVPPGLPGGGSPDTVHFDLPPGEPPALEEFDAPIDRAASELEMVATVATSSAPVARDQIAPPSAEVIPVSIDGPVPAQATTSPEAQRTSSDRPPEVAASQSVGLPSRSVAQRPPIGELGAATAFVAKAGGEDSGDGTGTGAGSGTVRGNGGGGGGGSGGGVDSLPQKGPFNLPPRYPTDALLSRVEGRVVLRALVGSDGLVEELAVDRSSGWPSLDEAALDAVRRWRFLPARRSGIAVAFEVLVPVRFSIRNQ